VDTTIESLEGGAEMTAESMFEGFEHNPYEAEARERYGDDVVDESWRTLRALEGEDAELAKNGFQRVHSGLAPLLAGGVPVEDPRVQELVALHHRVVSLFWEPSPEAYRNLGTMYVEDPRFSKNMGGEDVAHYLRDAMAVYGDTELR
jgi:hypothetical protein